MEVKTILGKQELSKTDLVALLDCRDTTEAELFRHSRQLRDATIGNGVHMRGLIEISNVCIKDCLYCGIRKSNSQAQRYELNDEEIVEAAIFAYRNHYGSVCYKVANAMIRLLSYARTARQGDQTPE